MPPAGDDGGGRPKSEANGFEIRDGAGGLVSVEDAAVGRGGRGGLE